MAAVTNKDKNYLFKLTLNIDKLQKYVIHLEITDSINGLFEKLRGSKYSHFTP